MHHSSEFAGTAEDKEHDELATSIEQTLEKENENDEEEAPEEAHDP